VTRRSSQSRSSVREHGVERVVGSYADLVSDPEIDVVYNPLPNGLHGPWNSRALQAGKHVLSEKPSAGNAQEAAAVDDAVRKSGTTFTEAFHYLFHPVTRRMLAIAESGELGRIEHIAAAQAGTRPLTRRNLSTSRAQWLAAIGERLGRTQIRVFTVPPSRTADRETGGGGFPAPEPYSSTVDIRGRFARQAVSVTRRARHSEDDE